MMSEAQVNPAPGALSRIPFTAAAEQQIKTLSFWLTVIGWLNMIAGVADVLNLALSTRNAGHLVNAVLHFIVGGWAFQAAKAFKNVATTDVADQAYLVEGFRKLRSIFLLHGLLILIAMAFITAVLLFLLFYALSPRPA
jgi:hypothetical protein